MQTNVVLLMAWVERIKLYGGLVGWKKRANLIRVKLDKGWASSHQWTYILSICIVQQYITSKIDQSSTHVTWKNKGNDT